MARRPRDRGRAPGSIETIIAGSGTRQPDDFSSLVDLGADNPASSLLDDGSQVTDTDDGGAIVDLDPAEAGEGTPDDPEALVHDANLAEFLSDQTLNDISSKLLEQIEADWKSGEEYRGMTALAIKLLGVKKEDKTWPFKGACGVTDPMLLEALIRSQATARGEMLPASGPVKTAIIGISTPDKEDQADRIKSWMNYYLTEAAPEFYPDYDQMLFWLFLVGSTFKKTYDDPLLGRIVSPYLTPDDLIVAYNTVSLATCPRVTHKIAMYQRDLKAQQISRFYRDVPLGEPATDSTKETEIKAAVNNAQGTTPDTTPSDDTYEVYESHVDWNIPGFEHQVQNEDGEMEDTDFPLPYIITVEKQSQKILAIRRNWKADDAKKRKRNWFTHYKFLPGLGFYGFGYCHILAPHTDACTMILRQLIDLGTLNNFPGGVRVKGVRMESNTLMIGPCEFPEVDTGGLPIDQAFKALPYREPSEVLRELRNDMVEAARRLANTSDLAVGDGRQDAPVGTTMALLEASTKVESAALRRIHSSLRDELRLYKELFAETLTPGQSYPFPVQGGNGQIMAQDFNDSVDILPISDPNYGSATMRLVRAEARLRLAQQSPQIHNMREVYKDVYLAMGVEQNRLDQILPLPPPPQPLDPVSENQMALKGQPLAVGPWQDDDAHIAVHQAYAPLPQMAAHISEHLGNKFRKQIEQVLGFPLPPMGSPMPPQVETQISLLCARAAAVVKAQPGAGGADSDQATEMAAIQMKGKEIDAMIQEALIRAEAQKYNTDVRAQVDREKLQSKERTNLLNQIGKTASGLNGKTPPIH